ncbi:MAG TPA: hypothetical protein VFR24_10060 [Candidatus Angelobacter sp.]|nr:hypothetical protein [Candidatus Angelobacter sp.]
MSDQNDERKLGDLLDSALASYSTVEPRPGLEGRILARIQDAAKQPRVRWWSTRWLAVGAIGAAIAVMVLSVLFLRPVEKRQQVQVHKEQPAVSDAQSDHRVAANPPRVRRENRPHHAETRQELARRDRPAVFPTPTGLSEQEKLMLAYVAQTPKEELMAQVRIRDFEKEEFWKDPQPAASRSQR